MYAFLLCAPGKNSNACCVVCAFFWHGLVVMVRSEIGKAGRLEDGSGECQIARRGVAKKSAVTAPGSVFDTYFSVVRQLARHIP